MKHPYISKYPVSKKAKNLILGTHPPMPLNQGLEFFYGNMTELWKHLSMVYPSENLYLNLTPDLELISNFLDKYLFSITDLVYETDGCPFNTDAEIGIVSLNPFLKDWLEQSEIENIYFTSFSGKNNAFQLFKRWYRENYVKPLDVDVDGYCLINERKVRLIKLYSPSPTARIGISGSPVYKTWLLNNPGGSIDQFRVEWYKRVLPEEVLP